MDEDQESEPLAGPIQGWFFNLHNSFKVDPFSAPLLLLFYADKTFSGKHRCHHPIYSKFQNKT
jgi:hypothetical protein